MKPKSVVIFLLVLTLSILINAFFIKLLIFTAILITICTITFLITLIILASKLIK